MNKCIVIDREYGSGGREVARLLAEKLGIPWYDGARLLEAAREMEFDDSLVQDYDEEGVGGTLTDLSRMVGRDPAKDPGERSRMAYEERRRLILRLARFGNCVFLGRCADEVLRRETQIISIFVYASNWEERAERVRTVDGVSSDKIEAFIRKKDDKRRRYYKFFTGREWGERENYDLLLNTSALGYRGAAELIATLF